MGKLTATALDESCTQISFPITNGSLGILTGTGVVVHHEHVIALYWQLFCELTAAYS